jgi:hypothetical protein
VRQLPQALGKEDTRLGKTSENLVQVYTRAGDGRVDTQVIDSCNKSIASALPCPRRR